MTSYLKSTSQDFTFKREKNPPKKWFCLQLEEIGLYYSFISHVGNCTIRWLFSIWLTFIRDFVYLYITKQPVCSTCFIVPHMALFHVLTTERWVCFLQLISRELWVGVNRSVVAKLLNQANKSWVYREAWYSFFTFSTQTRNEQKFVRSWCRDFLKTMW